VPAPVSAARGPVRVEPVPGTEFGVAYLSVPPTVSGLAVGSLVAGIGSISIAFIVGCFGVAGSSGWGPLVAGAFAVLAGLIGLGSVGLGYAAVRQVRAAWGRISGRALGIAGMVCGGAGVLLTAGSMLLSVLLVAT
jgi:hypothetical protein